jgi:hypothetical protein
MDMEKNTQKPNESVESFQKRYREVLDEDFAEMLEMNFADFRKEAVGCFKNLYAMMHATTDVLKKEQERFGNWVDVLTDKLHERDKLMADGFKERDEKLDSIAATVFFLALKAKGGPITKKDREEICEMLGYEWTGDEETAFRNCVGA